MKTIRNMRELKLVRQNLEYKEKLYEKEVAGTTAEIVDNLTDKLRELAFNVGSQLIVRLFKSAGNLRNKEKAD